MCRHNTMGNNFVGSNDAQPVVLGDTGIAFIQIIADTEEDFLDMPDLITMPAEEDASMTYVEWFLAREFVRVNESLAYLSFASPYYTSPALLRVERENERLALLPPPDMRPTLLRVHRENERLVRSFFTARPSDTGRRAASNAPDSAVVDASDPFDFADTLAYIASYCCAWSANSNASRSSPYTT